MEQALEARRWCHSFLAFSYLNLVKLVNNTFRCEKIDPGVCRDEHGSDLQILTRLTLGQVMMPQAPMCEHSIEIRNCIHGSIRVLNMLDINATNCTVRVRAGCGSHVILSTFVDILPVVTPAHWTQMVIVLTH